MKAGRKEHCRSMWSGSGGPWPIRRVRKRLLQQIRQKTGNMIVRQGPDQLLFAGYSKIPDSRPRHESRGFLQIRIYIYRQDGGTEHVARGHFHPRIAFRQHVLDHGLSGNYTHRSTGLSHYCPGQTLVHDALGHLHDASASRDRQEGFGVSIPPTVEKDKLLPLQDSHDIALLHDHGIIPLLPQHLGKSRQGSLVIPYPGVFSRGEVDGTDALHDSESSPVWVSSPDTVSSSVSESGRDSESGR